MTPNQQLKSSPEQPRAAQSSPAHKEYLRDIYGILEENIPEEYLRNA